MGFLAIFDCRSKTPLHDAKTKTLLLTNGQYFLLLSSNSVIDVAEGAL